MLYPDDPVAIRNRRRDLMEKSLDEPSKEDQETKELDEATDGFISALVDNLVDDIPRLSSINPRAVKANKIEQMFKKLGVKDNDSFMKVFGTKSPLINAARTYVNLEIFGMDVKDAKKFAKA